MWRRSPYRSPKPEPVEMVGHFPGATRRAKLANLRNMLRCWSPTKIATKPIIAKAQMVSLDIPNLAHRKSVKRAPWSRATPPECFSDRDSLAEPRKVPMSETEQTPFTFGEFTDNPEPRCACLLLLDTSGSMAGAPIDELNAGLRAFKDELSQDSLAMKRVEIAIVTFGPVKVETDFQTVDTWQPPHLTASGVTPMGAAIVKGLEMLRQRKDQYRANAIEVFRPWVFLMTDGEPTDAWQQAAEMVKAGEASKGFAFFGVGVANANMETLGKICVRSPVKMAGLKFKDLFAWLSSSLSSVSSSKPGTTVKIAPHTGWSEV